MCAGVSFAGNRVGVRGHGFQGWLPTGPEIFGKKSVAADPDTDDEDEDEDDDHQEDEGEDDEDDEQEEDNEDQYDGYSE